MPKKESVPESPLKGAVQDIRATAGGTLQEVRELVSEVREGAGVIPRKPVRSFIRRRQLR